MLSYFTLQNRIAESAPKPDLNNLAGVRRVEKVPTRLRADVVGVGGAVRYRLCGRERPAGLNLSSGLVLRRRFYTLRRRPRGLRKAPACRESKVKVPTERRSGSPSRRYIACFRCWIGVSARSNYKTSKSFRGTFWRTGESIRDLDVSVSSLRPR